MLLKFSFSFLFFLSVLLPSARALEVPSLGGPVMDLAGVMTLQNKNKIEKALYSLNSQNDIQIQVLTLTSLEGDPIEDFSIRAVDKWKLGGKKADKGALLLIAVNDRKMRIEVGDGLEGQIPDLVAGRIIDSMKPFFKSGDFDSGIYLGVSSIANEAGVNIESVKLTRSGRSKRRDKVSFYINLAAFIIFIILVFFRRRGGLLYYGGTRSSWGSGSGSFGGGSGGGWSGGGGSFSGGGSSGSW